MSITFDNLVLRHGTFRLSAHLVIEEGHKIALLGPSGGGKSTLLSAIAGFKKEEQGRIYYNNQDITDLPPAERPVTLLFQDHNLFPHLSVEKNIALGIRPNLRLSAKELQTVQSALARVGLQDHGGKMPSELSGGQRQRVALARALLRGKPVLCLDEPFAALGPALKHEMLDLVAEIVDSTNTTLLMVTHDPDDARYITDQTVLVADGVVSPPEETELLFTHPPAALQDYLGTKKGA